MRSPAFNLKPFFILVCASLFVSGCLDRMVIRPTVAVREIQVTGLSLSGVTLTFGVELENPNGFGITVTDFSYTLFLNNRAVANGAAPEPISIDRHSITKIALPLKTSFSDIVQELQSMNGSDAMEYRIEGTVTVRSMLGRMEFPYSRTGVIGPGHSRSSHSPGTPDAPSMPRPGP
jgi:LEA14-like dessication related protein